MFCCINGGIILTNCYRVDKDRIKSNFEKYNIADKVYFPLKANDLAEVLSVLDESNSYFLINNNQHFETLKMLKISPTKIMDINYLNLPENRETLYLQGIRSFSFGSPESLIQFKHLNDVKAAFRMNLTDYISNANPIGANISELLSMCEYVKKYKTVQVGLQLYISRGILCDIVNILEDITKLFTAYDIRLSFLNIGGMHDISALNSIVAKYKPIYNQINFEIGENIINDAVCCECTIRDIKSSGAIFIGVGIYSGCLDSLLFDRKYTIHFETRACLSEKYIAGWKKYNYGDQVVTLMI